ncbi:hypothetical protein QTI24_06585 [Variovorax sp. J22P240]|uniref:hypothetical protein n=1 Tax=Variovorax sp. J22P240 TaxID=3053514 RepID=UPI0025786C1D|nr:hypothetical protein [Variovorax sp. J22P240]MDL9998262.1 hypothetical protein [Variovorax sp. J22P240]
MSMTNKRGRPPPGAREQRPREELSGKHRGIDLEQLRAGSFGAAARALQKALYRASPARKP